VAFGHHVLAVRSLRKGLSKLQLDQKVLKQELDAHPEVVAEAIQTVMRKHCISDAYEQLKRLTRGAPVTKEQLQTFIAKLPIPKLERERLTNLLS
jgi:adenylosuccinate lyase